MSPILSRAGFSLGFGRRRGGGGGSIPISPITATGGTATPSGSFTVHTFTSPGTFTVTSGNDYIQYLVIAGGGGGGGYGGGVYGAGGGAGGYRTNVPGQTSGGNSPAESVSTIITPGLYPVSVGPGGASETNGSPSHFGPGTPFPVESIGGGYGGRGSNGSGGGSGGGAGWPGGSFPTGGSGTSGQGFVGGRSSPGSTDPTLNFAGGVVLVVLVVMLQQILAESVE